MCPGPRAIAEGYSTAVPEPVPSSAAQRSRRLSLLGGALLIAGVVWSIGLWGTTLLARLDETPRGPLILAILVLPWAHRITLAGLALLALGMRHRLGVLLLLVHLLLTLGMRGCPRLGSAADTAPRLDVAAWNLGRLGSYSTGDPTRCSVDDATATAITTLREQDADVSVLLEINQTRLSTLAESLALDCEHIDYHGQGVERFGGLAVCAARGGRWSITRSRSLPLPPGWRYVFAELSDGEHLINVLALHLSPYGVTMPALEDAVRDALRGDRRALRSALRTMERSVAEQSRQMAAVIELVAGFSDPTIIAGDFNATPDSAMHVALRQELTDAWLAAGSGLGATRTVGILPLRIDYIYTTQRLRPEQTETFECTCSPERTCSDHSGLLSTLAVEKR